MSDTIDIPKGVTVPIAASAGKQGTQLYKIGPRVHENRYDPNTGQVVPGWSITATWLSTGTQIPVFVADTAYTPGAVDAAIRAAGLQDDQLEQLGTLPVSTV